MRRFVVTMLVLGMLMTSALPLVRPAAAQDAAEPGSLAAMLKLVPLRLGSSTDMAMLTYSNPARQAETAGVAPAELGDEEGTRAWINALGRMGVHSRAGQMPSPEWEAVFGFSLFDIDQAVEYSAPPASISVLRGRFDADELVSHWEAEGYEARTTENGEYYSLAGDFEIDFESNVSRLAMASANHIALLGPDLIAFSSVEQLLITAIDLAAGTGSSYASELNVASLLAGVPDDVAWGAIVQGSALIDAGMPVETLLTPPSGEADIDAMATEMAGRAEATAAMPPIALAFLGQTVGGPPLDASAAGPATEMPPARAIAVVVTASASAAETAAEVIDTRLAEPTPRDWSEFFAGREVTVLDEEPVVVLTLEVVDGRSPSILIDMLYRRDLGFLTWGP